MIPNRIQNVSVIALGVHSEVVSFLASNGLLSPVLIEMGDGQIARF